MGTERKPNKKCIVCGKKYYFCVSCNEAKLPAWHAIYCGDNCRKIYNATADFHAGLISKEDVKKMLDECDLSNKAAFHHVIREDIAILYMEEVSSKKPEISAEKTTDKAVKQTAKPVVDIKTK